MKRLTLLILVSVLAFGPSAGSLGALPSGRGTDPEQAFRELVAKYGCDKVKGWALSQPARLFQAVAADSGVGSDAFRSSLAQLDKALSAIQALEEAISGDNWKAVEITGSLLTDVSIGMAGGPIGAALWTTAKQLNDIATAFTKFAVQANLDTIANRMEDDPDLRGDGRVDHFLSAYLQIDRQDTLSFVGDFNLQKLRSMLTDYAHHELGQKDFPYFTGWEKQRNRVRSVAASYLASAGEVYQARRQVEQLQGELAQVAAQIEKQREVRAAFEAVIGLAKGAACADHLDDTASLCLADLERIDRLFEDSASRADHLNRSTANALGITYEQLALTLSQAERLGLDRTLDRVDRWCQSATEQVARAGDLVQMAREDVGKLSGSSKIAIARAEEACTAREPEQAQLAARGARELAAQAMRTASAVRGLALGLKRVDPPADPSRGWPELSRSMKERVEEGRILLEELDDATTARRQILKQLAAAESLARALAGKCGDALTPLAESKLRQLQTVREVLSGLDLPSARQRQKFELAVSRVDDEQLRLQTRIEDTLSCLKSAPSLLKAREELAGLEKKARAAQTDLLRHAARAEICARSITDTVPMLSSFNGTWKTNWGTMKIRQGGFAVSAVYTHDKGKITGTVEGNVMTGTWSEAPTYAPTSDAGDLELVLSKDGKTFAGRWRYGSKASWNGNWNGTRVEP